jgi:hypothetical protein
LNSAFPSAAAQIPAAIDTVRRFFDGINHETDTGDEARVSASFTSRCSKCVDEVVTLKNLLTDGHTLRGGHVHLTSIDSAYASYSRVITIIATSTQDPGDQLDRNGRVVRHFNGAPPTKFDFELETDTSPPVIWQLTLVSQ